MSKQTEYPRASFKSAQELADAVDSLGGTSSTELAAAKIGNKVGGAFFYIMGAAQKFNLITHKAGQIKTSDLYREIKLAYTEEERTKLLISSFLLPPVFSRLYERFKDMELPIAMLDKMLIKEYEVDDNAASRIKKYFIEGAKNLGLLNAQNKLIKLDVPPQIEEKIEDEQVQIVPEVIHVASDGAIISLSDLDEFVFHITGPGVNSRIAIREEEDFIILEAMIRKIKKRFDFS
ncbi:MAG: hypothetical protein H7289_11520 [Mucilaginibacter sp.]|nr:hypothetical protein [Mucilaginibacter sp.]